jgi:hypothetical protein
MWVGKHLSSVRGQHSNEMCPVTETWCFDVQKRSRFKNIREDISSCRSQWPRCRWRRSAAAGLLGLRVPIPHGCVLWVLRCKVEVTEAGWSLIQESYQCGVFQWDRKAPKVEYIRIWSEWIKIYIGYRNMNEMKYCGLDWEFGNWEV